MGSVFRQLNTALDALGPESGAIAWGMAQAGMSDSDLVDLLRELTTSSQVNSSGVSA